MLLEVAGHLFSVTADAEQDATYHFECLDSKTGYGFSVRRPTIGVMDRAEAERMIQLFIAQIDPTTGHIP